MIEALWWLVLILGGIGFALLAAFIALGYALGRDLNKRRR